MGLVRGFVDSGISKAEGYASYAAGKIPQSTVYVAKVKALSPGTMKRVSSGILALSDLVDTVDAKLLLVASDEKVLKVQELGKKATRVEPRRLCRDALALASAKKDALALTTVQTYEAQRELRLGQAAACRKAVTAALQALEQASVGDLKLVQAVVGKLEGTQAAQPLQTLVASTDQVLQAFVQMQLTLEVPRPLRTCYDQTHVYLISLDPTARLSAAAERGCFYAGRLQAETAVLCTQAQQLVTAQGSAVQTAVEKRIQESAAAGQLRLRAATALEAAGAKVLASKPAVWQGCVRLLGEDLAGRKYAQMAPLLPGVVAVWLDLQ